MKTGIITLILLQIYCLAFGQKLEDGKIRWNENLKLELADFKIKTDSKSIEPVFSQFTLMSNPISHLELFKRNFNKKVENIFMGNASWIDTTKTEQLERQLEFQQIQFDLSEIQARTLRKKILLNKKKLRSQGNYINQLMNELTTEFSNRRLELFEQTKSWTDREGIDKWTIKIKEELEELNEYSYSNEKKIKKTSG